MSIQSVLITGTSQRIGYETAVAFSRNANRGDNYGDMIMSPDFTGRFVTGRLSPVVYPSAL